MMAGTNEEKKEPFYDQQPLEAAAMVEAAVDAYYATKDKRYTAGGKRSL